MASADLHAPFSVHIKGNLLVVTQSIDGAKHSLCTLDLRHRPSFYLHHGKVVCRDTQGLEFTLDTLDGVEANELLTQLTDVQLRHGQQKAWRWPAYLAVAASVFALIVFVSSQWPLKPVGSALPAIAPAVAYVASPVPTAPHAPTAPGSAGTDSNGWTLPTSIQASLPQKLQNAADRKLFTVDYSSGHARTLYVFADPSCPNCKRMEPALNALASDVNVVVFPVPVIGKAKSIAAITPVLCLPPAQRKAAWDALFDPAPEGLNLGKHSATAASEGVVSTAAQQPDNCDVATKALGINQVAYQAYRIPGTPWVIADDGRYVSQALLRDPLKLQAFLDQSPAPRALEVSDARQ